MSDTLRKTLTEAGLDPRLHGGIDGAVLLLAGQRRELEASNVDYRVEIAFLRWELDELKKGRATAHGVLADRRPWEDPSVNLHADVLAAVAAMHEKRFDEPIPAEVLLPDAALMGATEGDVKGLRELQAAARSAAEAVYEHNFVMTTERGGSIGV